MLEDRARSFLEEAVDLLRSVAGRRNLDEWYRVGWHEEPTEFVPRHLCSFEHRFDDPEHEYRTLYCAETKLTALREVLADLRPNVNARADFARWQLAQGVPSQDLYEPTRRVTRRWREQHALAVVTIERDDRPLVDIDEPALRDQLEREHAELLRDHGMAYLNVSEVRSKNRAVTQTISRDLYEQDAAGILFRSNIDDGRCVVIFEGNASLEPLEDVVPLSRDLAELDQICTEWGLILEK